jgi:hypothetical protein
MQKQEVNHESGTIRSRIIEQSGQNSDD